MGLAIRSYAYYMLLDYLMQPLVHGAVVFAIFWRLYRINNEALIDARALLPSVQPKDSAAYKGWYAKLRASLPQVLLSSALCCFARRSTAALPGMMMERAAIASPLLTAAP